VADNWAREGSVKPDLELVHDESRVDDPPLSNQPRALT